MALLDVQEIAIAFGGVIGLAGVSCSLDEEQMVGLIGPNGAGKTTLLNCVSRFYTPRGGQISFLGHDLLRFGPADLPRLGLSRTFQNIHLFSHLTVQENVLVGAHSRGSSSVIACALGLPRSLKEARAQRDEAYAALESFDLLPFADRPVGELPHALQRRVDIARAVMCRPKLLMMDEPAAGLSDAELMELDSLIKQLQPRYGVSSILLVEHHVDLVMRLCSRVIVLDFGQKIAEGTPQAIQSNEAVIAAYLGDEKRTRRMPETGDT